MNNYIIPTFIVLILALAIFKRVNVYQSFTDGIAQALKLIISIFPYVTSVMILIELFSASGLMMLLTTKLQPAMSVIGFPPELLQMLLLRPISGNGSIALLDSFYQNYGVDSYLARVASVMLSSSDTTFYIASVYFADVKIKSLRYGIPVALFSTLVGAVVSCIICRFI